MPQSLTLREFMQPAVELLEKEAFTDRLWKKDAGIWKSEPQHQVIINNSLGWLDAPSGMLKNCAELEKLADEIRRDFSYCVVLGMGGSSLAPEVFRSLFPKKKGYPELLVLDSTDPGWVLRTAKAVNLKKTIFIFSSKSGGTVEPNSFFQYFYEELKKVSEKPANHFIAITDPGTTLEKLARLLKFRKVFLNRNDIGGRFSALSYFGLVPAAIAGVDLKKLLARADAMLKACGPNSDPAENPAVTLGAAMGAGALAGKDKLTLLLPHKLQSFGLWIEQLVAESSGKEGKGIVPVAGEPVLKDFNYQQDRIFVQIKSLQHPDAGLDRHVLALREAGHPVVITPISDVYDIGAEFVRWEIATAAAGAILKINPFDQPNVQESKTLTQNLLNSLDGAQNEKPAADKIILSAELKKLLNKESSDIKSLPRDLADASSPCGYAAVLSYMDGTPKTDADLLKLRAELVKSTGLATLFGYGPRYLHSSGQLHKGGGDNAVFLILLASPVKDVRVPGQKYSFAQLERAQALGDFKALESKGRRVFFAHLADAPLDKLIDSFKQYQEEKMAARLTLKKPVKPAKAAASADYIVIDHPKHNETIPGNNYTFRIGASACDKVEISIDDHPWKPCRHAVGYWWHDWHGYVAGNHQAVARMLNKSATLVSRRRRFKVSK